MIRLNSQGTTIYDRTEANWGVRVSVIRGSADGVNLFIVIGREVGVLADVNPNDRAGPPPQSSREVNSGQGEIADTRT